MDKKSKLIVLFSNWYSGATLFTILMNKHSKVVSNGEGFPFSSDDTTRYRCSCGDYIDECDFFQYAASHMMDREGTGWDRDIFVRVPSFSRVKSINRLLLSPRFNSSLISSLINHKSSYQHTLSRFLHAQYAFFKKATEYSNASVYMDGTKSIRRAQLFARDNNVQLQVINLVRDGRAFCHSYIKNRNLGINSIGKAAREWKDYIQLTDNFFSSFSHINFIDIRYEDLCDKTYETLNSVFNFLDLPYEDIQSHPANEMHILGNRMRKTFNGKIMKNTDWETALSNSALNQIDSIIGPELKRFNYK